MLTVAPLALLRALATGTVVVLGLGGLSVALLMLVDVVGGAPAEALDELIVLLLYGLLAYSWSLVRRLRDESHLLIPSIAVATTLLLAAYGEAASGVAVGLIGVLLLGGERLRRHRRLTRHAG